MAGAAAPGRVMAADAIIRGDLVFALANASDDADVRRMLRENALGGRIALTLEREPNAFSADFGLAAAHAVIIARDRASGVAIGLCERVVRRAYIDGAVQALPYLGALRVAPSHRHRIGVLRGGFEALELLARRPVDLPFALTSITADNALAKRLLTRGLPRLPHYHPVGAFSTFALRSRRNAVASTIAAATAADLPDIAAFLQRQNARFQFAQVWSATGLRALAAADLEPGHFLVARRAGEIRGCLAVWDQRAFRQAVVRRYPPWMQRLRPLLNAVAPFAGTVSLPAVGEPIAQAVLSHLAVADDDRQVFLDLVAAGLDQAARRGLGAASIGFATERGLRGALLQRYRAIEYRTSLYLVHWPEAAASVSQMRAGLPHPELGLL